ncbi:MAG TPA: DNA cytosine methyltransferase [Patescibacteria group bacterium]|nr:DNA cytosine methyltransferase [Patescibacteria group bacterium]
MKKRNKKYNIISLFAGCGGLDLGFVGGFTSLGKNYSKRKFQLTWSNEIDKDFCHTYRKYFKHEIVCDDINNILYGGSSFLFDPLPEKADIVLGGFPCQDFSHAGKRRGFSNANGRGVLYKSMIEVIRRTRPAVFVAENVKGLLTMNKGEAIKIILEDFEKLGYHVSMNLYLAAEYGVPQMRERVIIVGTDKARLPKFEHKLPKLEKNKWITLKEAIGDLEDLPEGAVPNHFWSKAKMFPGTQGNSLVSADKPGPTMRAEHHGNIEFHWNGKRRLSAREAARIQTFPDDFIFYPSTSSAYKQIGNAVPPVLAWNVAKSIEEFLDKNLEYEEEIGKYSTSVTPLYKQEPTRL